MTLTFPLSEPIEIQMRQEIPDLERYALEAFVAETFRNGKIGSAVVAEMLGLSDRWAAIEFLSERGVYPGYELEDLESDRQVLKRFGILEQ